MNLSDFIFILTYYNMVFKMALYLVLEKNVFLLSIGTYFEVVLGYENEFQEMIIFNELG